MPDSTISYTSISVFGAIGDTVEMRSGKENCSEKRVKGPAAVELSIRCDSIGVRNLCKEGEDASSRDGSWTMLHQVHSAQNDGFTGCSKDLKRTRLAENELRAIEVDMSFMELENDRIS